MNAYFLRTGEFINDSAFPSFVKPVLYYPLFGYSGIINLFLFIADILPIHWTVLIKFFQVVLFNCSALLMYKICCSWGYRIGGGIAALLFLVYFQFFNVALTLMAENNAIFFMLLAIHLLGHGLRNGKYASIIGASLSASVTFMLRPVMGVLGVIMVFLVMIAKNSGKTKKILLCISAFLLLPLIQSLGDKLVLGTFTIREGLGWNLWNRVVLVDRHFPRNSSTLAQVRLRIGDSTFMPDTNDGWWGITSQLSRHGLQPSEIQRICLLLSIEGIREHPLDYLLRTLRRSFIELPLTTSYVYDVRFGGFGNYHEYLVRFRAERQHQPLADQVLPTVKTGNITLGDKIGYKLYQYWSTYFDRLDRQWMHGLMLAGYWAVLLLLSYQALRKKDRGLGAQAIILCVPLGFSVGTEMMEVLVGRYNLPCLVIYLIGFAIGIDMIIKRLLKIDIFTQLIRRVMKKVREDADIKTLPVVQPGRREECFHGEGPGG
ncbi:MAG: hypothetical protein JW913_08955 [Chitinispirillaceae bacterium]|nr:hypothetical protein [Chitinispirillaceae bacterium]